MNTRLVVSLAGIEHRELPRCEQFAADLDRRGVPLSLLLSPSSVRSQQADQVVSWVSGRTSGGDGLALHGFGHGDTARPPAGHLAARAVNGIRRAELSTLPAHEAGLRLVAALSVFERAGMRPVTFASPHRSVSAGTVSALHRSGFAVCADVNGVRELASGRVYSARVHALGQARAESWRFRRMVTGVGRAVRSGAVVQLAVDATDLAVPDRVDALLDAVDLALQHEARAVTYRELTGAPTPRSEAFAPHPRRGTNLDPLTS